MSITLKSHKKWKGGKHFDLWSEGVSCHDMIPFMVKMSHWRSNTQHCFIFKYTQVSLISLASPGLQGMQAPCEHMHSWVKAVLASLGDLALFWNCLHLTESALSARWASHRCLHAVAYSREFATICLISSALIFRSFPSF